MKITPNNIVAIVFSALGIVGLIMAISDPGRAQNKYQTTAAPAADRTVAAAAFSNDAQAAATSPPVASVAPFIVDDTETDSPGTNMVTRIVTFKAQVGGTPPPRLQWKVDHGKGFEAIAGATRATYRIGNAQVTDSGSYSLFATNSAGSISSTPVPLYITEGED
jgi:hypothetical protein